MVASLKPLSEESGECGRDKGSHDIWRAGSESILPVVYQLVTMSSRRGNGLLLYHRCHPAYLRAILAISQLIKSYPHFLLRCPTLK
ncbi:hypothetical protein J6590_100667, partial [Homalodisca vitripennis]